MLTGGVYLDSGCTHIIGGEMLTSEDIGRLTYPNISSRDLVYSKTIFYHPEDRVYPLKFCNPCFLFMFSIHIFYSYILFIDFTFFRRKHSWSITSYALKKALGTSCKRRKRKPTLNFGSFWKIILRIILKRPCHTFNPTTSCTSKCTCMVCTESV